MSLRKEIEQLKIKINNIDKNLNFLQDQYPDLTQQIEQLENQIQCIHEFTIEYTFENGGEIWGHFVCDFCDLEIEHKLTAAEVKAAKTLNL